MDMKRYEEIGGREALERLLNGLNVFNCRLQKYQIENEKLVRSFGDTKYLGSTLSVSDVLSEKWYVKKPFDVRAEMLARPNEWVGAYKDKYRWLKIGFDTSHMIAVMTDEPIEKADYTANGVYDANKEKIDHCIPIEDVPEEEL